MKYNECINCVERAVKNLPNIPNEKRKQYEKSIKDIKRRKDDPFLNVVLIGDFSTGKSTFINALIKENMLKTSWFATTAIPTHIYYHNKNEIIVKVETSDGTEYDLSERYAKRTVEAILKCELPNNIKDLITFITTSNELADNIRLVKVYCRSEEEFRHICIIDTPGVNPGACDTKSHVMATRNVLREYADAAIVLFQAQQVYTNSFKTFLEENAKHFMDEAVFVITMIDQIDESERSEIIEFVRSSLQETFHLSNPLVFGCCAKYVNKKNASDEEQEWSYEFDRLRRELTDYINRRREHIIEKQMSLLLENLLKPLEQDIKGNIAVIERELAILKQNSIENLSGELSANRYLYEHEMENKLKKGAFEAKYNEMFSNIIRSATNSINSCTKVNGDGNDAVSGYIKNGLPALMERENKKLVNEVNQVFSNSEKILKEYYDDNKQIFQKFSINLGKAENYEIQNKKMDSSNVELGKVSFNSDSGNLIGDGIAVGAILVGSVASLPLAVIDGIFDTDISETVLQTFFGFADGIANLFSNLSAKKSEAISSVNCSVDKMKESNRDKFMQQIADRKTQMRKTFVEINTKFESEYRIIYEKKQQTFLKEKAQMEHEITKNKVLHKALTTYLTELSDAERKPGRESSKRHERKKIAVLGRYACGKYQLLSKLSGKKIQPLYDGREYSCMVTFGMQETKAGFETFHVENAPKEKQDFIFIIDPKQMLNNLVEMLFGVDAVIYVISAVSPLTREDRIILEQIEAYEVPSLLYISQTDVLEEEEYKLLINFIRQDYCKISGGKDCELWTAEIPDYETKMFERLGEMIEYRRISSKR